MATARTAQPPDPAHPHGLRPLGLVVIGDPLRSGATGTAAAFEAAGIRLLLITGDHPATAAAIGDRLGILGPADEVITAPPTGQNTSGCTRGSSRSRRWRWEPSRPTRT